MPVLLGFCKEAASPVAGDSFIFSFEIFVSFLPLFLFLFLYALSGRARSSCVTWNQSSDGTVFVLLLASKAAF